MSDSEDAFQSADEGEGDTKNQGSKSATAEGGSKTAKKQAKGKRKQVHQDKEATKPDVDQAKSAPQASSKAPPSTEDSPQKPSEAKDKGDHTDSPSKPAAAAESASVKPEAADSNKDSSSSSEDPKPSAPSTQKQESVSDTPQRQKVLENLTEAAEKQSGWGSWGNWGSSLLNTATSSVATFTSQVGEGFTAVLDTVESSLGAPDPEELVKQDMEARRMKEPDSTPNGQSEPQKETPPVEEGDVDQTMDRGTADVVEEEVEEESGAAGGAKSDEASDWFSAWGAPLSTGLSGLSSLTQHVQSTGKTLVTGSLDVLESVGKKAYDVIAEGDHGLKKTIERAGNKTNLSQTLREAKEVYEAEAQQEAEFVEARKAHFGSLFDEYNGLVHLEALELVSNTSEGKVHSILGTLPEEEVATVKASLVSLRDAFNIEEEDDEEEKEDQNFSQLATDYTRDVCLPVTADNLTSCSTKARAWLHDCQEEQQQGVRMTAKEMHQEAIQTLARMTACSVQYFHKVAQLVQLNPEGPMSVHKEQADTLAKLTQVVCTEIEILSSRFTDCLNSAAENNEDSDSVNPLITNVYLEAGNGKTYIQDAFQLLLPVMQHASLTVFTKQ